MAAFTAQDVKALREKTGCGMMDCKKALTQADGDMDKAIDFLREQGLAKQAKKASRVAAEGDDIERLGDVYAENEKILSGFKTDAISLVDVIHGNALIPENPMQSNCTQSNEGKSSDRSNKTQTERYHQSRSRSTEIR